MSEIVKLKFPQWETSIKNIKASEGPFDNSFGLCNNLILQLNRENKGGFSMKICFCPDKNTSLLIYSDEVDNEVEYSTFQKYGQQTLEKFVKNNFLIK